MALRKLRYQVLKLNSLILCNSSFDSFNFSMGLSSSRTSFTYNVPQKKVFTEPFNEKKVWIPF